MVLGDVPFRPSYPIQPGFYNYYKTRQERLLNVDQGTLKVQMKAHMPVCTTVVAVMCSRQSEYVWKRCSLVWCFFSVKITPLMLARSCSLSLASRLKLLHQWNIWFGFSFCFIFIKQKLVSLYLCLKEQRQWVAAFSFLLKCVLRNDTFKRVHPSEHKLYHLFWSQEQMRSFYKPWHEMSEDSKLFASWGLYST